MTPRKLFLTAGFDRALHVVALADLLKRDGHELAGILVVTPFSRKRLQMLIRQRGKSFVGSAVKRLIGRDRPQDGPSPLKEYLRQENVRHRSLKEWSKENGIPYHVVSSLNHPETHALVKSDNPADLVLYGGGGIVGKKFLEAARGRVLNAHSGPLPSIRGMNALEWSILLKEPPTVTIHVIDRGIDTGGTIEPISVPINVGDTVARLREVCAVLGVQGLRRAVREDLASLPARSKDAERYRQCFVMSPVIHELLESRMNLGDSKVA